jgi:hypothetical protein
MLDTTQFHANVGEVADQVSEMLEAAKTADAADLATIRDTLRELLTDLGPLIIQWIMILIQQNPTPTENHAA